MDVDQMEKHMRSYEGATPIFIKNWGEKEYHAIRFVEQHYDKVTGKPFILIIPEDDISGEVK